VNFSEEVVRFAVEGGFDGIVVHHGMLWRPGLSRVVGRSKALLSALFASGVNLFVYHLPLDLHPEVNTSAALARAFGVDAPLVLTQYAGFPCGRLSERVYSYDELSGRLPKVVGVRRGSGVGRVAIVAGSGNDFVREVNEKAEILLTGELSLSGFSGLLPHISVLEVGHSRSEEFGVKSLMEVVDEELDLEVVFYTSEWYK